jgi:hypothetical protein
MSHTRESRQHALTIVLDWAAASSGTAIAEADLVHGLVEHFGNDGALWGPLLADDPNITGRGLAMPTKMFVQDARIEHLREWFRSALGDIVKRRMRAETRDRIAAGRARVAQVGKHYQPESPEAAVAFVLDLLLDDAKVYGADLRACQLEGCSRFFFLSTRPREPGKRRVGTIPKYCSPEHMVKAHNRVKAAWTQKARKDAKRAAAGKLKAKRKK